MAQSTNPWTASVSVKVDNHESLVLTYAEAARLLKVSKRTIERMVESNELPVIYVRSSPRISRAAIQEWMEKSASVTTKKADHGKRDLR